MPILMLESIRFAKSGTAHMRNARPSERVLLLFDTVDNKSLRISLPLRELLK